MNNYLYQSGLNQQAKQDLLIRQTYEQTHEQARTEKISAGSKTIAEETLTKKINAIFDFFDMHRRGFVSFDSLNLRLPTGEMSRIYAPFLQNLKEKKRTLDIKGFQSAMRQYMKVAWLLRQKLTVEEKRVLMVLSDYTSSSTAEKRKINNNNENLTFHVVLF